MKQRLMQIADGVKHDAGKRDWSLLPIESVEEIVKVLDFGARKYDRFNWTKVPNPFMRYYAATMRHMAAWRKGHKIDKQSRCSHLAHAACCLLFLMDFDKQLKKERKLCQKILKNRRSENNLKSAPTVTERRKSIRKAAPGVKVTVRLQSEKA